jgi:exoribonuclease R
MLQTNNYIDFEIVDPVSGAVQDSWTGATRALRCLPGDKVCATQGLLERAEHELVGVLHLTSKYMYGMTSRNIPLYLCEPLNKGYPCFRVACKEKDRSQNLLVAFAFESWDSDSELPRGSLRSVFGPVEDIVAEKKALAHLSCPYSAPKSDPAPDFLVAPDRLELSHGTFNIDPPGCKDIDDVLTLLKNQDDSWTAAITIADVSESVYRNSKPFIMAKKIAATTYQDGVAVRPMFHPSISEDACSLLPGKQRYGLSLLFDWSLEHGISNPQFKKTLIVNQESYTYESIYESKTVPLDILAGIASSIAGRVVLDSHEWIEHYMLFYNTQAAKLLSQIGLGILRIHDAPVQEKSKLLEAIDPSLKFLAYSSALYAPVTTSSRHFGLDRDLYCHASSPIRRFADLVNQYIIKAHLSSESLPFQHDEIQQLVNWLNKRQRILASAERDYAFLKAVSSSPSSQIEGRILWTEAAFTFVWIPSWQTTIRLPAQPLLTPGATVTIHYYCDRRKAKWKERLITTYSE